MKLSKQGRPSRRKQWRRGKFLGLPPAPAPKAPEPVKAPEPAKPKTGRKSTAKKVAPAASKAVNTLANSDDEEALAKPKD